MNKKLMTFEAFTNRPTVLVIHMYDPVIDDLPFNLIDFADVRQLMWNDPEIEMKFEEAFDDIDAIIISGSHSDPEEPAAPTVPGSIAFSGKPVLGICYGYEWWMMHQGIQLKELVNKEETVTMARLEEVPLFKGLKREEPVVMKHKKIVASLPDGYEKIASTDTVEFAGAQCVEEKFWGLQFHPEKNWIHDKIFDNFLRINNLK